MKTRIYDMTDENSYRIGIADAAKTIRSGGLVVFPTETVYGLGANALDAEAVSRIFLAKGRPSDNPLIIHVTDMEMADVVSDSDVQQAEQMMKAFMPGPITVILKKKQTVPDAVTAGLNTVAVRMPEQRVARDLIAASGVPIAAPSANLSGKPSPTAPEDVLEDMDGKADVILLDGECRYGVESTVVDCTVFPARILRPGAITQEELSMTFVLDESLNRNESERPKAPGMKYRHYKPNASVTAVCGSDGSVVDYINERVAQDPEGSAVLAFEELKNRIVCAQVFSLGCRDIPMQSTHVLFAQFRECDRRGIRHIYTMCPKEEGIGRAFMNRLQKAADEVIRLKQS